MVKYTLQLRRKEMTMVMEFLVRNLKSHMWVMAIRLVEFSNGGEKIRKIVA